MRTGIYIVMILCLLAGGTAIATGGNDGSRKGGNCDTLQALVLNSNSAILNSIKELSGAEILTMIDSLLDEKAIPVELIREINDYAESRLLEHTSSLRLFVTPSLPAFPLPVFTGHGTPGSYTTGPLIWKQRTVPASSSWKTKTKTAIS